jgi:hypothetical protein
VENYLNARTTTVTKGDHQPNMTEPDQMPTNNILLHEGVYFIQVKMYGHKEGWFPQHE